MSPVSDPDDLYALLDLPAADADETPDPRELAANAQAARQAHPELREAIDHAVEVLSDDVRGAYWRCERIVRKLRSSLEDGEQITPRQLEGLTGHLGDLLGPAITYPGESPKPGPADRQRRAVETYLAAKAPTSLVPAPKRKARSRFQIALVLAGIYAVLSVLAQLLWHAFARRMVSVWAEQDGVPVEELEDRAVHLVGLGEYDLVLDSYGLSHLGWSLAVILLTVVIGVSLNLWSTRHDQELSFALAVAVTTGPIAALLVPLAGIHSLQVWLLAFVVLVLWIGGGAIVMSGVIVQTWWWGRRDRRALERREREDEARDREDAQKSFADAMVSQLLIDVNAASDIYVSVTADWWMEVATKKSTYSRGGRP